MAADAARKKSAAPYTPGTKSPLHAVENELEECFRLQTKHHGVAVIDLAPDKLVVHGIDNAELKSCIAGLAKKVKADKPLRCSVAFGPMPVEELPAVEITESIKFLGTKVAENKEVLASDNDWKIATLYEAADKRVKAAVASKVPVALYGPLLVKPLDTTPMMVVNAVQSSLVAAGEDPILAVQRGGGWKPLRKLSTLPVVPVPVGTGGSWNFRKRPSGDVAYEDERVHMSILVTPDQIWVGISRINEFQEIKGHDLAKLAEVLATHKKGSLFGDRTDLEIAGDKLVPYGQVVDVIDAATKAGFTEWTFTHPAGLAARPL